MNRRADEGFTLIELTVVMAIITIVFFFSIPRLQNEILTDPSKKTSRWLLANVRALKERSFREKKDYILYIDTNNHSFRIPGRADENENESDMLEPAADNQYQLPENMRIIDVEFPGNVEVSTGIAEVYFYAKGYSDTVFIHMEDDQDRRISFLIEPFLPLCRYYEHHVGFEE